MKANSLTWRISTLILLLALTACGASDEPPTPTQQDTDAIFTQAAQTVAVQLTQTYVAIPTQTFTPAATATQVIPPTFTLVALTQTGPGGVPSVNTQPVVASPTSFLPALATATGEICNNSAYVADVGTPDGTVVKAGQPFAKGWLIQNVGSCPWGIGYFLQRTGGNTDFDAGQTPYTIRTISDAVPVGQIVEISVRLVAPRTPGKYEAFYQMYSNLSVPFGTGLSVSIEVRK